MDDKEIKNLEQFIDNAENEEKIGKTDKVHYTPLENTETGIIEQVDNSQLNNKLSTGQYRLAPDSKVLVKTPTGELKWEDSNNWTSLSELGYQIPLEEDVVRSRNVYKVKQEIKQSPIEAAKTALEGFARGASLGSTDYILPKLGISNKEKMALRKKYRPALATGTEIASTIGTLLIPGLGEFSATKLLGKAPAAAKAASILAKAAKATPVGLVPEAGKIITGALGGGKIARTVVAGLEMIPFSASSSITEAALGDPKEAAEHFISNLTPSVLLGMGVVGVPSAIGSALGVVGKVSGLGEKKLLRPFLTKSWRKNLDVLHEELGSYTQLQSVELSEELARLLKNPELVPQQTGLTPIQNIKSHLRKKYFIGSDVIEEAIPEGATIENIGEVTKKLVDGSNKRITNIIYKTKHAGTDPSVVQDELNHITDYVQDALSIQENILAKNQPKVTSLVDQLLALKSPAEQTEFLGKLTETQLENLSSSVRLRRVGDPSVKTYTELQQKIKEISSSRVSPVEKTVAGLEDYTSKIKLSSETHKELETTLDTLLKNIETFKTQIGERPLGYSPKTIKILDEVQEKLNNRLALTSPITGETIYINSGIIGNLQKKQMTEVFERLSKIREDMEPLARLKTQNPSQIDLNNLDVLNTVFSSLDDVVKNEKYFGEIAKHYTDYSTALYQKKYTMKDILLKLFVRSKVAPSENTRTILYENLSYRPSLKGIKAAVTNSDNAAVDALKNFQDNYKTLVEKHILEQSLEPTIGKVGVSPVVPTQRLTPNQLRKNLDDFDALMRMAEGGSGFSAGLFKEASKYGPLGFGLYWMGASLPTIALTAAVGGLTKHAQANPHAYFEAVAQVAQKFHQSRRALNSLVKSNILKVPAIAGVKAFTQPSINEFETTKRMLGNYSDPQKRFKNLEKVDDFDAEIMPKTKQAFYEKTNSIIDYLQSQLPKGTTLYNMFGEDKEDVISDVDKRKFMEIWKYANSPMSLLEDFPNISINAVDAVKNMYPEIFTKIQQEIINLVPEIKKANLTKEQREAITKLVGDQVAGRSPNLTKSIQMNWQKIKDKEKQQKEMLNQGQAEALSNMGSRLKNQSDMSLE